MKMRNRIEKYTGRLIVLCTVCNSPIYVPFESEKAILYSHRINCRICGQKSDITKELKEFILFN